MRRLAWREIDPARWTVTFPYACETERSFGAALGPSRASDAAGGGVVVRHAMAHPAAVVVPSPLLSD